MDMTDTIIPRSDQLNAEDLLSGPRTVTIAEVRKGASAEQPVNIYLAEFPNDRPFKPSKTVRRILVAAWGVETSAYVGRRMTIYRDPAVRFGGQDVGGIRISHLSDIEKRFVLALTVTKGKRAPYVVEPLADEPADDTAARVKELRAEWKGADAERRAVIEAEVAKLTQPDAPDTTTGEITDGHDEPWPDVVQPGTAE